MTTKHVFDSSEDLVVKAHRGATKLNPDLRLHAPTKSVYCKTRSKNARVALISGGGAGHEPAHAGYTGRGMLSASVSGDIFASPSASQILTCLQLALAAQETNQVLLIVNNYTGDRLNFGLAAERAHGLSFSSELIRCMGRSEEDRVQVEVETVVVADDVSLLDRPSLVGPRGLAGNILVCKLLGAATETGLNLSALKILGEAVVSNLASIGVGLAHCHVPGRTASDEEGTIEDGMCELGLGLHNEPGVRRMEVGNAQKLVREMLEQIMTSSERRARARGDVESGEKFLQIGDEVVLYVNNLGGMSALEMSAIVDEAVSQLESRKIHPSRVLLSWYMTSLNAPGFSLSLLNISSISRTVVSTLKTGEIEPVTTERLLSFIDAPTDATSWIGVRSNWPAQGLPHDRASKEEETTHLLQTVSTKPLNQSAKTRSNSGPPTEDARGPGSGWASLGVDIDTGRIKAGVRSACIAVLAVENDLTRFDTIVGDGDCGATFSSGVRAVLKAIDESELDLDRLAPAELLEALSELLLNSMGGTSGALFGLYFTALSNAFASLASSTSALTSTSTTFDKRDIRNAPFSALHALSTHTPALPGDRTIIDSLGPFCNALAAGEGLESAVKKAHEGAESTRGMRARLGRATYVGSNSTTSEKAPLNSENREDDSDLGLPPDPGAWGVAALLEGLLQGLRS